MPHDADYYRARAMEERERAQNADRVYLRTIHRQLAKQLDRLADESDAIAEEFDDLTERASQAIRERRR
jgi:cell division protein FtsB